MLENLLKGKKGDSNNLADFLDAILGRNDTKVKITIDVGKSRNERDINGDMYSETLGSMSPREQDIFAQLGINSEPEAPGLGGGLAPDAGVAGRNPMYTDLLSQLMGGPNPTGGMDVGSLLSLLMMLSQGNAGGMQGISPLGGGGMPPMGGGGLPPMPLPQEQMPPMGGGGMPPMGAGGGMPPELLAMLMGGAGGAGGGMPPMGGGGMPPSPAIPGSTPGGVQPALLEELLRSLGGGGM